VTGQILFFAPLNKIRNSHRTCPDTFFWLRYRRLSASSSSDLTNDQPLLEPALNYLERAMAPLRQASYTITVITLFRISSTQQRTATPRRSSTYKSGSRISIQTVNVGKISTVIDSQRIYHQHHHHDLLSRRSIYSLSTSRYAYTRSPYDSASTLSPVPQQMKQRNERVYISIFSTSCTNIYSSVTRR
jgi:hypothetical protein